MRAKYHILASIAALTAAIAAGPASAHSADAGEDVVRSKSASSAPEAISKAASEPSTDTGWSFKPRGRFLFDIANVTAPAAITNNGLGFSSEARRIRLGASGRIPGGFGYKIEADFAGGDVQLTDAFLSYKSGGLKITAGQHNNFQSLEELTSSNATSFVERAAFTDAFGFERRVGLSAQYNIGALMLQSGVFTANIEDLGSGGDNSISLDARAVFAPQIGGAQAHFGASYHWRDLDDAVTSTRYRQRPLVHSADIRFINTGSIASVKSETSYGLEAAIITGRFHAAAETHWLKANRTGFADPTFFGGTIEAGIYLTDDQRKYKDGAFKGVRVKNPVGKGGFGALQFIVRYDRLDLNDAGIAGGRQNGYIASLIWAPVDNIRFLVNYGKLSYAGAVILAGTAGDYDADVFAGRFQISF